MREPFEHINQISEWSIENKAKCPICLGPATHYRLMCKGHDEEWNHIGAVIDFINDKISPVLADSEWIANL